MVCHKIAVRKKQKNKKRPRKWVSVGGFAISGKKSASVIRLGWMCQQTKTISDSVYCTHLPFSVSFPCMQFGLCFTRRKVFRSAKFLQKTGIVQTKARCCCVAMRASRWRRAAAKSQPRRRILYCWGNCVRCVRIRCSVIRASSCYFHRVRGCVSTRTSLLVGEGFLPQSTFGTLAFGPFLCCCFVCYHRSSTAHFACLDLGRNGHLNELGMIVFVSHSFAFCFLFVHFAFEIFPSWIIAFRTGMQWLCWYTRDAVCADVSQLNFTTNRLRKKRKRKKKEKDLTTSAETSCRNLDRKL